jgi:hypothetical protein
LGFLKRLFASQSNSVEPRGEQPKEKREAEGQRSSIRATVSMGHDVDLTQLTGTTTFAKDAITELGRRRGIVSSGHLQTEGSIQREPENAADPHAVVVLVDGERIGYLSGYVARAQGLTDMGSRSIQVQIFYELLPKGMRAEAWAWLGKGPAQWEWSSANRPPMSSKAKAAAQHGATSGMVNDALSGGGSRAEYFKVGMVNGVHYLELIEPIKQLKREGRLEEALTLCTAAIEGAENGREGREPAPWYTEQAAIIHRKLGQRDEEVAVLTRWLRLCPPERREGSGIKARLDKLAP